MYGIINNYNFGEMAAMKYYAPPANWSDEKKKQNVRNKIYSNNWLAAEKKDGFFAKFVKDEDGTLILTARNRNTAGYFVNKIEWVPQLKPFFDALPNGTCLLGELFFPTRPGSKEVQTIMGCLKDKAIARQQKGDKIYFYVFDCLAYNNKLLYNCGYGERIQYVEQLNTIGQFEYVQYAKYYRGHDLWVHLQTVLANGGEGVVIMEESGIYEPGARPSQTTLKVKKELRQTIDCFFTGRWSAPTKEYTGKEMPTWEYWENLISGELVHGQYCKEYRNGQPLTPVTKSYFNHWAGSLEIGVYDGDEIVSIGWLAGVTEEMKADPQKYALKPIEVTAMEWDADAHTLRHGKMIGWRPDLNLSDCTLEKIDG